MVAQKSQSLSSAHCRSRAVPFFRRNRNIKKTDLSGELYQACRQHPPCPNEVKRLISLDPNAAQSRDDYGGTMLHVACSRRGLSLTVVRSLLRSWPEAVQRTNRDGSLPLHIAVAHHAAPEVCQYLIQAYPDAVKTVDSLGNLPLHEACATKAPFEVVLLLVQAWPEAMQRGNFQDDARPLHLACTVTPATFWSINALSFEVIWSLLETWPDAVMLRNREGDTPYDLLKMDSPREKELLQLLRTKRALVQMPEHQRREMVAREQRKAVFKSTLAISRKTDPMYSHTDNSSTASTVSSWSDHESHEEEEPQHSSKIRVSRKKKHKLAKEAEIEI